MPGISVIDADGDIQEFAEATVWHVDERGQLHLNDTGGKPVATFAKDHWQGAGTSESSAPTFNAAVSATMQHTQELTKIHDALTHLENLLNSGPDKVALAVSKAIKSTGGRR